MYSSGGILGLSVGGSPRLAISSTGQIGLNTTSPANDLGFDGTVNRSLGVENAAGGAGMNLLVHAGTSGSGTNLNGGDLVLSAGSATGTGSSNIVFLVAPGTVSGTSVSPAVGMVKFAGGTGVGINTLNPRVSLDVNGPIISSAAFSNAGTTIDFIKGNLQYTPNSCGAFALWNLKDGGTYSFVIKGTSAATCSFSGYSDLGTTILTMHLPPDHAATISGKHTFYTFSVVGTDVYVAWTPGY